MKLASAGSATFTANQSGSSTFSVAVAKIFTTSNPGSPWSWFYKDVIKRLPKINGIYLHFTMDDNPSLSEEVKERYKQLYSGVWKRRFIDG